jgi:hypothetical protein
MLILAGSCPIFPELRPILDEAFEIFGNGLEERQPTQRDDATASPRRSFGLATIVPFDAGQQANRTPARVPATRRLLLAWKLTKDRTTKLLAGDRG